MASAVPPRALVLLLVLTLVWGTNWPLFPIVMREMSVWTFRGVSMPAAGLLLLAIAHLRGQSLRVPRQHWGPVAAATFSYLPPAITSFTPATIQTSGGTSLTISGSNLGLNPLVSAGACS